VKSQVFFALANFGDLASTRHFCWDEWLCRENAPLKWWLPVLGTLEDRSLLRVIFCSSDSP